MPQAASTRAANALESSRLAGNDQGPEDSEPASGSASEEAESEESEEEELLRSRRFLECLDFFPFLDAGSWEGPPPVVLFEPV